MTQLAAAPTRDERVAPAFVRDAWYVAALRSEVAPRHMISREILGQSVALWRTSDERVVALRNRCSHRGYPLTEGTLGEDADIVTCGYHGFQFDDSGTCVRVPGQDNIPGGAQVAAFPVVERGPFIWIWPGDPSAADPDSIPGETGFADDTYTFVAGHVVIDSSHELIADNLLDLSHESFIHATKIGSREVAETGITSSSDDARWLVRASRVMRDVECPPTYRERTGLQSPIDREQHFSFFVPSLYVLDTMVAQAASVHRPEDGPRRPYLGKVVYALTPVSERVTHYFFAIGRDYAQDDTAMDAAVHAGQLCLIEEDAAAVALLQRMADAEGPPSEVSIRLDTAALIARRMNARRLRAESASRA